MNLNKCFIFMAYILILTMFGLLTSYITYFAVKNPFSNAVYTQTTNISYGLFYYTITPTNNTITQSGNMRDSTELCHLSSALYIIGIVTVLPTFLASILSILCKTNVDTSINDTSVYEHQIKNKLRLEKIYLSLALLGIFTLMVSLITWALGCHTQFATTMADKLGLSLNYTEYTGVYFTTWFLTIILLFVTTCSFAFHKKDDTLYTFHMMRNRLLADDGSNV